MRDININNGKQISEALRKVASSGLTVQSYCADVQKQPVFFIPSGLEKELSPINTYLETAKENATQYLDHVEPRIITVVTDVGAASSTFTTFAEEINGYLSAWASGSSDNKSKALNAIGALKAVVDQKGASAQAVSSSLQVSNKLFTNDAANFKEASLVCDTRLAGDQGALAELEKQLTSINKKIAGASVGVGLSGLALIGGVFVICVGTIADFVTAGTSTPITVTGVALVVVGAGGLTASSIVLANLIDAKGELLKKQKALNNYITAVKGCKSSIDILHDSAEEACKNLNQMKNAWDILGSDLGEISTTLTNARTYSEMPSSVQLFFDTAQDQWSGVKQDVEIIKQQMTGVTVKTVPAKEAKMSLETNGPIAMGMLTAEAIQQMTA